MPRGIRNLLYLALLFIGLAFLSLRQADAASVHTTLYCVRFTCQTEQPYVFPIPEPKQPKYYTINAKVSAYNTVENQTDSTPCEGPGGNVCGRQVVACPRSIPLHTWIEIEGVGKLECMDRMNVRYTNQFDLSFDKDIKAAINWGVQTRTIKVFIPDSVLE